MPNQRETTITNELVNILRTMRHGWQVETAVNAFISQEERHPISELVSCVIGTLRVPCPLLSESRIYAEYADAADFFQAL